MSETQADILEWARATFGSADILRIAARCGLELAELLQKVASGDADGGDDKFGQAIVDECADIAVMTCQMAELRGVDMEREASLTEHDGVKWPLALAGRVVSNFGLCFTMLQWRDRRPLPAERLHYGRVWSELEALCALYSTGESLLDARTRKMKINRVRKWHTSADGRSQHVPGT